MFTLHIYDEAKDRQQQIMTDLKAVSLKTEAQGLSDANLIKPLLNTMSTLMKACERVLTAHQVNPTHWGHEKMKG
jgi:hypothetical protein